MFSCILGLGAAFGIMFMLGMEYNQTHHILPFIAIGFGIDDMFVIMECWYNLLEENKGLPLPERVSGIFQVSNPETRKIYQARTSRQSCCFYLSKLFYKPNPLMIR